MTFPAEARAEKRPPNPVVGQVLNAVLMGSGFTYIGHWGWHLAWLSIGAALWLVATILGSLLSQAFLILPLLGWLAQFFHFGRVYRAQADRNFQPALDDGVKVALIVAHFALSFMFTGLLAAVLIPNLLGARQRADQAAERAVAMQVYTDVMARAADKGVQTGPCPDLPVARPAAPVDSCRVDATDPQAPTVDITFTSGRSVHLP